MPSDDQSRPTDDTSSNIFGPSGSNAEDGASQSMSDSAVETESAAPQQADSSEPIPTPHDPMTPVPAGLSPGFMEWPSPEDSAATPVDPEAETVADEAPAVVFSVQRPSAIVRSNDENAPSVGARRHSLPMIALISYSSAATLALIYFFFTMSRARQHALESLPDVPPLDVEQGEVMRLVPADADLPPGHQLSLGESRRFGNLLIAPLRVVVEPVEFEHFSGRVAASKPPTLPVLKIWIRFTNVSDDQMIVPLDAELLFRRALLESGQQRANQFVGPRNGRVIPEALVLTYDHPATSEWDLIDQKLGRALAPGDSVETYIPSGADGMTLGGPLDWRVHFRKGFSPSGFGVTTLVDVHFDSADIQSPETVDVVVAD